MTEMISLEEAQALVLANVAPLSTEVVEVLDAVGRVSAADLASDIDIAPFAHSAMDGFAVHAAELENASEDAPVELDVIAEIGAGEVYDGPIEAGQCVLVRRNDGEKTVVSLENLEAAVMQSVKRSQKILELNL